MKQIFDWLREQIANEINEPTCIRKDYDFDDGLIHARDLINEAEAKWESECCEKDFAQRIKTVIPLLEVNMLYGTVSLLKDLADELGIKISEVE